jgi:hypothetical protein
LGRGGRRFKSGQPDHWPADRLAAAEHPSSDRTASVTGSRVSSWGSSDGAGTAVPVATAWRLPSPREVPVEDGSRDDAIAVSGDPDWAGYLRRMLAVVTE